MYQSAFNSKKRLTQTPNFVRLPTCYQYLFFLNKPMYLLSYSVIEILLVSHTLFNPSDTIWTDFFAESTHWPFAEEEKLSLYDVLSFFNVSRLLFWFSLIIDFLFWEMAWLGLATHSRIICFSNFLRKPSNIRRHHSFFLHVGTLHISGLP